MKHLIPTLLGSILIFAATGCYTQLEVSDYSNQTKETLYNQNCQYERTYVQTEFGLVKRYQKVCRNLPYRSYYHNYHHRYQRPLKEKKEESRPRGSTIGCSPSKKDDRNRGEGRSRENKKQR